MDLSKEKWVVANGLQVWRDGPTTASSPRICTIQNAALPVEQLGRAEQAQAAALIAAAPDLLEVVEALVKWDFRNNRAHFIDMAAAAIAKAKKLP